MSITTHNHDSVPGVSVQSWDNKTHSSAPLQPSMIEQIPPYKRGCGNPERARL